MNASRLLLVVLLLAAAVAATFFVLSRDSGGGGDALAAVAPGDLDAALDPGELATGGPGAAGLRRPDGGEPREAREGVRDVPGAAGEALEILVRLPAGAPPDAELAVVAVREGGRRGTSRQELLDELRADPRARADAVRAEVDAAGRARLRLPAATPAGDEEPARFELLLDGRFLFLDEPVTVAPDARSAELDARLGACLVVAVEDVPGARELAGELALTGGRFGGPGGGGWTRRARPIDAARPNEPTEFRALDPELTWMLVPALETHHADAEVGLELAPGEERRLALRPTLGATVRGTATDDAGLPLAGVEVSIAAAMPWMAGAGGREAVTDDEGRFELRAIAPGEQQLEAELEGWRSARSETLTLEDGAELAGVVLALDRGEAIAGTVRWPDGSPAEGARVVVEARRRGGPFGGGGGWGGGRSRAGEARADASGAFRVSGLDEGAYTVRAARRRNEEPGDDGDDADEADRAEQDRAPTWRAAEAGVRSGRADVALTLAGPEAFDGRVVDDRGEPVTAFRVEARSLDDDDAPREAESFEDDEGRFTFARVGPGEWGIEVEADGHVQRDEASVVLPSDGSELVLVLDRTARVAGRVVDASGRPVAGASVLANDGRGGGNPFMGPQGKRAETDEAGSFELDELAPGALSLTASAEGWADSLPETVELAPGAEASEVVLALRVGGRIEGLVLTPEGDPIAERRVTWGPNAMGFGQRGETSSDAAGSFAFDHVTPGEWAVSASPSMTEIGQRMRGRRDQAAWTEIMGQLLTETVRVADGETVEVFLGGEPRQPVRIFGTVTLAGAPVPDATVVAVSEGSAVFEGMKSAQAAADGSYELTVDRPGPHVVSARSESVGVEATVEVPRQDELRVDLAIPLGRIAGVVRKPGGRPAAGVRVSVQREDGLGRVRWGGDQARTDEGGAYSIEALAAGRYTVRVNVAGFGGGTEPEWGSAVRDGVEVGADVSVTGVDFELERAGVVEGTVVDPSGTPVAGASIFFRDAAGRAVARVSNTTTNAAGEFRHEGLAPGEYLVGARADGYASGADARVTVASEETARARIEVEAATTLVVRLEEDDVERRARFEVFDRDGVEVGGLLTMRDLQSLFNQGSSGLSQRIGPLAAGRYTVRATTADGRTAERKVTLRERDGEKDVRLKLDAAEGE